MHRFAILLFIALAPGITFAKENKEYVGLVYPPAPQGLVNQGGGLAFGSAFANGLWYAHVKIDGKKMIWLESEVGRSIVDGKNLAIWQVIDTLPAPVAHKGETVAFGNDIECFFKNIPDTTIIAVGKWTWRKSHAGGYVHHITQAWRVDPLLKKFEVISPRHVRCELNEDRN